MTDNAVVRATGLTKRWGTTVALDEVGFEIPSGVTGLLGANGAGKTTLLECVLGLHRADGGELEVRGVDPWTAGPAVRARIGYAPEHDCLPGDVRAQDFVRHMAEIHGIPRREARQRASDVLQAVGLGEERFRPARTMSTGQKQRVKLAQAVVADPALVLLDEPTNGLDPLQREEMQALIRHVGRDMGMDVIVATHLLGDVERICDQVVVLDAGRVTSAGPLAGVRREGTDVLLEVDGRVREVVRELRTAGLKPRASGTSVLVRMRDPDTYDKIRDAVVAAGAGIRRLGPATATLQEALFPEEGPK
jgi:ABC-2 type transport system ATP-binding protein